MADAKVQSALQQIEGLEGQVIGSGQCYALSGKYSLILGGCGIDSSIGPMTDVIGDTMAAANIGSGFNWKAKGWSVKFNPTADDLKNASGAIINFKANQGAPLYTGWAGHTGVLLAVNGDQIITMEQNGYPIRSAHKYTRSLAAVAPTVSSICLPPGAGGNGTASGSADSSGSGSSGGLFIVDYLNWDKVLFTYPLLNNVIDTLVNYTDQVFDRPNPNYKTNKEKNDFNKKLSQDIKNSKDLDKAFMNPKKRNFTELQMLAQDITTVTLFDGYGDNFNLYPLRYNFNPKDWNLINSLFMVSAGLGYNSDVTITPINYDMYNLDRATFNDNEKEKPGEKNPFIMAVKEIFNASDYKRKSILEIKDKTKDVNEFNIQSMLDRVSGSNYYTFGLKDTAPKSLGILNDSTASYMQSNRSQIEAKRTNFNEQNSLIALQSKQRLAQASLANNQAMFGANYQIQKQQYANSTIGRDQDMGNIKSVIGGIGKMADGSLIGGASSALMGVADNNVKAKDAKFYGGLGLNYLQGMKDYTAQGNQLRSTEAQLANMAAKMGVNQAIRSFNASLADLGDQPDTLQQMGDDISKTNMDFLGYYYYRIQFPEPSSFKQIYTYIRDYGSKVNTYVENVQSIFRNRKRFNYVKVSDIDLSGMQIPQHYKDALKNVFVSGTRFWNESAMSNNLNPFDTSIDNVDYEGEQTINGKYTLFTNTQLKEFADDELTDVGLYRRYHRTLLHFKEQTVVRLNSKDNRLIDVFIPYDSYWEVDGNRSLVTLLTESERKAFEKTYEGKFKTFETQGNFAEPIDTIYDYLWSYGDGDKASEYNQLYPIGSNNLYSDIIKAQLFYLTNSSSNDIVYYNNGEQRVRFRQNVTYKIDIANHTVSENSGEGINVNYNDVNSGLLSTVLDRLQLENYTQL